MPVASAPLLSAPEFIKQLEAKIGAVDPHIVAIISRYEEQVRRYGNDDAFKLADGRQRIFLLKLMHMGGGELNDEHEPISRAKLTMVLNHTKEIVERNNPRHARDFYLTYPLDSLKEWRTQFEDLCKEYPEYAANDEAFEVHCRSMLDTIDACIVFIEQQKSAFEQQAHVTHTHADHEASLRKLGDVTTALKAHVEGPLGDAFVQLTMACEPIYTTTGDDQTVRDLFHQLKGVLLSGFANRIELVEEVLAKAATSRPAVFTNRLNMVDNTLRGVRSMFDASSQTTLPQLAEAIAQSNMPEDKKLHAKQQLDAFTESYRQCADIVDTALGKQQGIALG